MNPATRHVALCLLVAALVAGCGVVPPSRIPLDLLVEKEVSDLEVGLYSPDDAAEPLRLNERMDELGVKELTIALVNEGELRWARSFGDRSDTTDATEPSASGAGSTPEKSTVSPRPVFPRPGAEAPITEFAHAVDVGDIVDIPLAFLALRPNEDQTATAERMNEEILQPLKMTASRFEDGKLHSTAEDLTKLLTDLQKAHAGKPTRRVTQDQARAAFGTTPTEIEGPINLGLHIEGTGQAIHFEHRTATATHLVHLAGFVFSGHGAVIMVDNPKAGPLVDEILAGLAELYDWPAYRAVTPSEPDAPSESP